MLYAGIKSSNFLLPYIIEPNNDNNNNKNTSVELRSSGTPSSETRQTRVVKQEIINRDVQKLSLIMMGYQRFLLNVVSLSCILLFPPIVILDIQ